MSKVKYRKEEQREVSGKQGEEIRVKGLVDAKKDRMTQEEGWVPWGRAWEQNWIGELQFVKFTDKSWSFQQSLSVMGSAG